NGSRDGTHGRGLLSTWGTSVVNEFEAPFTFALEAQSATLHSIVLERGRGPRLRNSSRAAKHSLCCFCRWIRQILPLDLPFRLCTNRSDSGAERSSFPAR